MTDTAFSLSIAGKHEWMSLHQNISEEKFEVTGKLRISAEEVRQKILLCAGGREPHEIASWSRSERNAIIRQLKEQEGLSIRQIERATGISRGIVAKC